MSNIAVIYWSMTGNTKAMAEAIAEGAKADLFSVDQIDVEKALEYEKLALGCPAMGAEVLEEIEFEPFFTAMEGRLGGKSVGLFGSYGWGDGQWMRDWADRVNNAGGRLFRDEGLMINETPDDAGLETCRTYGAEFAAY